MIKNTSISPGLVMTFLIAGPCWYLGSRIPLIGGPVFAILTGIAAAHFYPVPELFKTGIIFTSKKVLQLAIILIGFGMNLNHIASVGWNSLFLVISVIAAALLTAAVFFLIFGLNKNSSTLIGVGTAICGGSAIAATAPVIRAKDDEVAMAISTIFLFNIIAVLVFPAFGRWMGMTDISFGLWAGTAINDTSSVVAAGQIWGEQALQTATIVKLVRTLMIIPVAMILALMQTRDIKTGINLSKIFPWFILFFLAASVMTTLHLLPSALTGYLSQAGRFLIIMAMAAIGLNTNLKKLFTHGLRPMTMGLGCWVAVAVTSLVVQALL